MDFLKYLDVIIGLSVVMVLLSPLVTAITHAFLWWTNSRSTFLEQALQRLIVQLEGHPATVVSVRDQAGQPVPDVVVKTAAGTEIKTDPSGDAWLPDGLPAGSIVNGNVTLSVANAPARSTLLVRRIPQSSPGNERLISVPTSAAGEAELPYAFDGSALFASNSATLVVKDAKSQQVAADVTWSIGATSSTLEAPASGRSGVLTRPSEAEPSARCTIQFKVVQAGGAPLADHVIEAEFKRNDRFDRTLGPQTIGEDGAVSIETSALTIADAVVRHPMVARIPMSGPWPIIPPFKNRNAEVIEREELIRIILELAAGEGGACARLTDDGRLALKRLLALNEILDPAEVLSLIRKESQRLEHEEPHLALHVRHAKAIVLAKPSAFVGKINHWFDAAMARATQQYTAKARTLTIVAAFLVAVILQFNSFELLQRLSIDNTFRSSLVEMAKVEQERIDKVEEKIRSGSTEGTQDGSTPANPPDSSTPDGASAAPPASAAVQGELELLKAKRQEIGQNLAALRSPELAILPDHLLWQSVPRARLLRDPLWAGPYPSHLQLVAGGTTWDVQPAWREDYLRDLKTAIDAAGAPVVATLQKGDEHLILKAATPFEAQLFGSDAAGDVFTEVKAEVLDEVVETELRIAPDGPQKAELGAMQLVIDGAVKVVPLQATDRAPLTVDRLRELLSPAAKTLAVNIRCERNGVVSPCPKTMTPIAKGTPSQPVERVLVLTARDRATKDIQLLSRSADPSSNLLGKPQRRPRAWRVPAAELSRAGTSTLRLFTYERVADRPRDLKDASHYVDLNLGPRQGDPSGSTIRKAAVAQPERRRIGAPGAVAQAAMGRTAAEAGMQPSARKITYVELPREPVVTDAPELTGAAKAAVRLNQHLKRSVAESGNVAQPWPPTLTADVYKADQLVLTATRLGELALRHTPGKADTNILSQPAEAVTPWSDGAFFLNQLGGAFGPGVFGILLSWALLSLGAPFWFDALKNALKLRPSAAITEEKNSKERQVQTPAANSAP